MIKWKHFPRYLPPVNSPHKGQGSFDAFFDLGKNKRLSKQSWGWWFETPSRPLWRHCDELQNNLVARITYSVRMVYMFVDVHHNTLYIRETSIYFSTMTSSNGNIFRVLLAICEGIHRSSVDSPHQGRWHGALMFYLTCAWTNGSANIRDAGDLRCHIVHFDVTDMSIQCYHLVPMYMMYIYIYIYPDDNTTTILGTIIKFPMHFSQSGNLQWQWKWSDT